MADLSRAESSEEKEKSTLDKIEKLIVDGQKEVLAKITQVETGLTQRIDGVETSLGQRIDKLDKRVDNLDKKIDTNTTALYDLLKDVQGDVKKVDEKLEIHLKVPHAV